MGTWSEKQEERHVERQQAKTSREMLSRFFYDLAKLTFAAMALAGGVSLILEEPQLKQLYLLAGGLIATTIFAWIGFNILKK